MDIMETVNFVEKFIVYIEDHLRESIDYDQVLIDLGVDSKSFMTIFTSLVGLTPFEYQEKRRMTEIAYELYQGHRRLIDVAKYYGYKDTEVFKSKYREYMGISPYDTEKHIKKLDLLERISFEIVPVDYPRYPSRLMYMESMRIVGVTKQFPVKTYNKDDKYQFIDYVESSGITEELIKYNNGPIKGIILYERYAQGEMELVVGVSSKLSAPFEETYTESGEFAVFEGTGNAYETIEDIYQYIFRRWRFKSQPELNCNFSIELIKRPFNFKYNDTKVQVWQALEY